MIKEFKDFILRGNVVDLAVGVVIGTAFTNIVNTLVSGVITPLIGLVVALFTNGSDLDEATDVLNKTIGGQDFAFGSLVTAIITFLITGLVLFLVVKAINKARIKKEEPAAPVEKAPTSEDYLKEIRDLLAADTKSSDK